MIQFSDHYIVNFKYCQVPVTHKQDGALQKRKESHRTSIDSMNVTGGGDERKQQVKVHIRIL